MNQMVVERGCQGWACITSAKLLRSLRMLSGLNEIKDTHKNETQSLLLLGRMVSV